MKARTNLRHRHIMSASVVALLTLAASVAQAQDATPLRYQKLHRVLTVLRSSAQTLGNMEKAEADWSRDLEYIEQVWRDQMR